MTKYNQIKQHLKKGYNMTGKIAFLTYGVYRLSSVIHRLRKEMKIKTEIVTTIDGSYARYTAVN